MIKGKVVLEHPERFSGKYEISKEKLVKAVEAATDKLESQIPMYGDLYPERSSVDFKYPLEENEGWVNGMFTGEFLLAYQLTGNKAFKEVVERQLPSYRKRIDEKIKVGGHDVGFVFVPSCVAAYKVLGNEEARSIALDAAEHFYNNAYSEIGGIVVRCGKVRGNRTMMDTMMNITLLFWAGQETGDSKYTEAATSHYKTTERLLVREDGSSFHHYMFDKPNFEPIRGLTLQGHSDNSCWSRGQAWGIYGFPIAYSYTKDSSLIDLHEGVTNFALNHLPKDMIPYWDYDFTEGDEPRDSSAGLISVCGMREMNKFLPDSAPQKPIFENASAQMLDAVIDRCTGDMGREYDGLVYHVSAAVPQKMGIDQCAVYGDYFYLESLMRFLNPDWVRYW